VVAVGVGDVVEGVVVTDVSGPDSPQPMNNMIPTMIKANGMNSFFIFSLLFKFFTLLGYHIS
jgi:hypothetical protein